jgi:uncharacterized protein YdaU (DUF1376 family)
MKRWNTHQLVAGGLLEQPGRLWREIEAALDEEASYFQTQEAMRLANERLKQEVAARTQGKRQKQEAADAETADSLRYLLE